MVATKEQERNALRKIRKIIENLGADSYIGTAFEGCFEIVEDNIEYDFANSMEQRLNSAEKTIDALEQKIAELAAEKGRLEGKAERLEEQLERELEWEAYEEKENVSRCGYENLAMQSDTRQLSDDEAKDMLYSQFGFAREKTEIVRSVPVYEINRHGQLRTVGTAERNPLYNATDWNYIRFNCGGTAYELYNDSLRFFTS